MELDAELIDVAGDLGPLRLVLFQLILQVRNLGSVFYRGCRRRMRDGCWLAAFFAGQGHAGGRGIDYKRGRAMRAGENDIVARCRDGSGQAACWLHEPELSRRYTAFVAENARADRVA